MRTAIKAYCVESLGKGARYGVLFLDIIWLILSLCILFSYLCLSQNELLQKLTLPWCEALLKLHEGMDTVSLFWSIAPLSLSCCMI